MSASAVPCAGALKSVAPIARTGYGARAHFKRASLAGAGRLARLNLENHLGKIVSHLLRSLLK